MLDINSNYKGYDILKRDADILIDLEKNNYIITDFKIVNGYIVELKIFSQKSRILPDSIGHLSNLLKLIIHNNKLENLPKSIGNLLNLIEINIHDNLFESLPETFGNLLNLQKLDLSGGKFKEFPVCIKKITNLKICYIHNNQIKNLPDSIGELVNLHELIIHDNHISNLPDSIGKLTNLHVLNIHDNQLKGLPDSIGKLSSLQELDISNNNIGNLPQTIGDLSNLIFLYAEQNQIINLPESIGNLSKLEYLNLKSNQIDKIPESIGNIYNLQKFNICCNQLIELPESIGNLSNLQEFDVGDNKLENLPQTIGELNNLVSLYSNNNLLKSFPESISKLSNLLHFHVNKNQITNLNILPEKLLVLGLNENYISDIPLKLNVKSHLKNQIEESFNFPLVFEYFPNNYINNIKDGLNLALQKRNLSKLHNLSMKSYYWNYIIKIKRIFPKDSRQEWTFHLYIINSDKLKRKLIKHREKAIILHFDHPSRKNNFIQFQMVIKSKFEDVWMNRHRYMVLLIRNITVIVETDRGDVVPLVFTDFYFKKIKGEIEFQSTAYLKFDPGYALEPFARLRFTDIRVEYHTALLSYSHQTSPELENIHVEINSINRKIDKITKLLDQKLNYKLSISKLFKGDTEKTAFQKHSQLYEKIIKDFKNDWEEPILPILVLGMGKGFGNLFGKYVEYIAAGVIVTGIIPSILQFLYKIIWSLMLGGYVNWLTLDLTQIKIPVWFEILSYIPLLFLFLYLTYKFMLKQRNATE